MVLPCHVLAYSDYLIAGGENIGIQLQMDGVFVIGSYEIDGVNPSEEAGLKIGDKIIRIDGQSVSSMNDITSFLSKNREETIQIGYMRNEKEMTTLLTLKNHKTGLYLKDTISGIGTLTFIDPNTKLFGALGHEIVDSTSGKLVESHAGIIFPSTIRGIKKSGNGVPGEKNASFQPSTLLGSISENTNKGIFGVYDREVREDNLYKVANIEDIKVGDAKIRTVIEGDTVEEFDIEIKKIRNTKDNTKNIVFQITDQELLEKTGGIIQGMSGSPIIQGEYIVGAVTHVVVDDPKKGYGILITNMLEEAEKRE